MTKIDQTTCDICECKLGSTKVLSEMGVYLCPECAGPSLPDDDTVLHAIRNHPVIGKGTCSYIDECWEDDELLEHLVDPDVVWDGTVDGAVAVFVAVHNLWREREEEIRNA